MQLPKDMQQLAWTCLPPLLNEFGGSQGWAPQPLGSSQGGGLGGTAAVNVQGAVGASRPGLQPTHGYSQPCTISAALHVIGISVASGVCSAADVDQGTHSLLLATMCEQLAGHMQALVRLMSAAGAQQSRSPQAVVQ